MNCGGAAPGARSALAERVEHQRRDVFTRQQLKKLPATSIVSLSSRQSQLHGVIDPPFLARSFLRSPAKLNIGILQTGFNIATFHPSYFRIPFSLFYENTHAPRARASTKTATVPSFELCRATYVETKGKRVMTGRGRKRVSGKGVAQTKKPQARRSGGGRKSNVQR